MDASGFKNTFPVPHHWASPSPDPHSRRSQPSPFCCQDPRTACERFDAERLVMPSLYINPAFFASSARPYYIWSRLLYVLVSVEASGRLKIASPNRIVEIMKWSFLFTPMSVIKNTSFSFEKWRAFQKCPLLPHPRPLSSFFTGEVGLIRWHVRHVGKGNIRSEPMECNWL